MANSFQVSRGHQICGRAFSESQQITAAQGRLCDVPCIAAVTGGTLTTRTDNTTGTMTMASSGHGIATSQRIDLYWTLAGVNYHRRGVIAGTVAGASIPLTNSGTGDNLPAQATAITVAPPVNVDFALDGTLVTGLAIYVPKLAIVVFALGNGNEQYARFLGAGVVSEWYVGNGNANPISATLASIWASTADPSAQTPFIGVVHS